MAMSRYTYTPRVRGRSTIATVSISTKIYNAVNNGTLGFSSHVLKGGERIEHIAGSAYGSSTYWWIIAAASGIGWWLQAPAGTRLVIPVDINEVGAVI